MGIEDDETVAAVVLIDRVVLEDGAMTGSVLTNEWEDLVVCEPRSETVVDNRVERPEVLCFAVVLMDGPVEGCKLGSESDLEDEGRPFRGEDFG